MKQYWTFLLALVLATQVYAQKTANLSDEEVLYQKCLELYNEGVYGAVSHLLLEYLQNQKYSANTSREDNIKKAALLLAKSAVKLEKQEGEKRITEFVNMYSPDPIASGALREMADFYFNNRDYEQAERYYNKINTYALSKNEREEVNFKKAYLLFVRKKFASAKSKFTQVNYQGSAYYYPANYYLGLCNFYLGKYEDAIRDLNTVKDSKRYSRYIPYYIAQIYFKQKRYDELIRTSVASLENNYNLRNRNEINQLVAQSYFELGDYSSALPYYEYFIERTSRLRTEDFYQAGFVYYQNEKYEKAKRYFEELGDENSKLTQNGLYHLADCYIKIGDKNSARNAFYKCSQLNFDARMRSESHFQYAKLSYELGYDNDAILSLQKVSSTDKNYSAAQELLGKIFLSTNNFQKAEQVLGNMNNRSETLNKAFHKVIYYRGVEEYQSGRLDLAKDYFTKASGMRYDEGSRAMALYWLAESSYRNKNYRRSNAILDQYYAVSHNQNINEESGEAMALYLNAYNYIKLGNFERAQDLFNQAILQIRRGQFENSYIKNQILPDAHLRLGDCYFKANNYPKALDHYNKVDVSNNQNYVYALYQKAIIKGLRGDRVAKVLDLESIEKRYPDSKYADDALYELGLTYLEIGELNKSRLPLEKLAANYKDQSELINQAYLKLGLIAYNQGSTNNAIAYYKACLKNNPSPKESENALIALKEIYIDDLGDPDGYFSIKEEMTGSSYSNAGKDSLNYRVAELKYEDGNYTGAIAAFTNYIQKYPKGIFIISAYYFRGESHFISKDYSEALDNYDYIVNRGRSQHYEDALLKAALISYNHAEQFDKALKYYVQLDKVAQSQEKRFEAQLGALRSAYKVGDSKIVDEMANKVTGNNLANNDQKGIAYFYLGKINYDRHRMDGAEINFQKASSLLNNVFAAQARYYLAEISYQKGQLNEAKNRCSQANRLNTNYSYWLAKGIILLSDILKDQGDYFNAKAALESLIENYEEDQELIEIAKAKLENLKRLDQQNIISRKTDSDQLEFEEE
jgi:TolA-binding protein